MVKIIKALENAGLKLEYSFFHLKKSCTEFLHAEAATGGAL